MQDAVIVPKKAESKRLLSFQPNKNLDGLSVKRLKIKATRVERRNLHQRISVTSEFITKSETKNIRLRL